MISSFTVIKILSLGLKCLKTPSYPHPTPPPGESSVFLMGIIALCSPLCNHDVISGVRGYSAFMRWDWTFMSKQETRASVCRDQRVLCVHSHN